MESGGYLNPQHGLVVNGRQKNEVESRYKNPAGRSTAVVPPGPGRSRQYYGDGKSEGFAFTGKHFIKTWHEKLKTKKQAVTLPDDGKVAVQLDLMRGTPSVLYKFY